MLHSIDFMALVLLCYICNDTVVGIIKSQIFCLFKYALLFAGEDLLNKVEVKETAARILLHFSTSPNVGHNLYNYGIPWQHLMTINSLLPMKNDVCVCCSNPGKV